MAFPDTTPRIADSDNNLLFKICQELSMRNGGAHPPREADSDNNLLYKIAQLIVLGGTGGGGGACAASLAACQAAAVVSAASLASCNAALTICNAAVAANPQDMQVEWTPTNLKLGEMFGYGTGSGTNFPGITSITFKGSSSLGGFSISSKANLVSLFFPAITSISVNPVFSTNPVLTTLSLPLLVSSAGFIASTNTLLPLISLPSLTTITAAWTTSSNPALVSILLPALSSASAGFAALTNTSLTTVTLSALVSLGGTLSITNSPVANLNLSSYVPTNGRTHTLTGLALTATSVNQILARAVANAAYVTGVINTSGGTSSAPTGQGIIDKATLITRGVTVTTN